MTLIVNFNPSIDRWYKIEDFRLFGSYTTRDYTIVHGGKGINVAKVIKSFNEPVVVTGFVGGEGGNFIEEKLDKMDISHRFIRVKGETKNSIRILSSNGFYTEIEEKGSSISIDDAISFYKLYKELIFEHDIICICGDKGITLPTDIFKELIVLANEYNKKVFLNTSASLLKVAVEASPYFVKLNKSQMEEYLGCTVINDIDIIQGGKYLSEDGIQIVIITLGEEGLIAFHNQYIYRIRVPKVLIVNSIGAGDSMVGGFISGLLRNYDFEFSLKMTAACATANVMEVEPGKVDMNNMKKIMNEIIITKSSF